MSHELTVTGDKTAHSWTVADENLITFPPTTGKGFHFWSHQLDMKAHDSSTTLSRRLKIKLRSLMLSINLVTLWKESFSSTQVEKEAKLSFPSTAIIIKRKIKKIRIEFHRWRNFRFLTFPVLSTFHNYEEIWKNFWTQLWHQRMMVRHLFSCFTNLATCKGERSET